jgi:hypothetical protein
MKFTSILFAALVAGTQFSSTFAQNTGVPDVATTSSSKLVVINVADNDFVIATPKNGGGTTMVKTGLASGDLRRYTLTLGTKLAANGDVAVVVGSNGVADYFTYTPNSGFVGTDTFGYTFITRPVPAGRPNNPSAEVIVKVTVTAAVPRSFVIPGLISNADAVGTVRGGLFNFAALTPGTPGTAALNSTINPVIGGSDNFVANSSLQAVSQNLQLSFRDFFLFFNRGS